jgi:hypothetical protein
MKENLWKGFLLSRLHSDVPHTQQKQRFRIGGDVLFCGKNGSETVVTFYVFKSMLFVHD